MSDDFGKGLAALAPRLLAYARALTRGTTIEADDLVHDALVEALTSEHNFDGGNLAAWVFTIQRRKFFRLLRAASSIPQKQDPRSLEDSSLCETMIAQPSQLDATYLTEVGAAIDALPMHKREALFLTAVDGLDQREVAELLGITPTAVKMRVFQARQAVGEFLKSPKAVHRSAEAADGRTKGSLGGRRGTKGLTAAVAEASPALACAVAAIGTRSLDAIELASRAFV